MNLKQVVIMIKRIFLCGSFMMALLPIAACGSSESSLTEEPQPQEEETSSIVDPKEDQVETHFNYSEKMSLGYHNPVSDYMFFADPTAIEYEGRLYVYGTNDTQQYTDGAAGAENTYEKIHSFQVVSTEDMVNWTYHGTIDVKAIAPSGRGVSWAPSIVSRVEADGLTHFYMYYSSSGAGVGVLTATHPLGPWTAPLGDKDLIDYTNPAIGDCPNPFDPGVVIDDNGTAWLAFGGGVASNGTDYMPGTSRICRLSADMLSVDGDIQPIPAPYFFEASELYYIGNRWIYLYNTSWKNREQWDIAGVDAPGTCSMCYMTSETPLQPDSWTYMGMALRTPGKEGMEYGNNHTHIHKYKGKYYMLYHTQHYPKTIGVENGYRSICVDPIQVSETLGTINCGYMTYGGIEQLSAIDGFKWQPASQASATYGINYESGEDVGEMVVHANAAGEVFRVNGVNAVNATAITLRVKGKGSIYLRRDTPDGRLLGLLTFDTASNTFSAPATAASSTSAGASSSSTGSVTFEAVSDGWYDVTFPLTTKLTNIYDLCFSFGPGDCYLRSWRLSK
jgi:hypothetical protein